VSTAPTLVVDYFSTHGRSFMDCLAKKSVSGIARYLTNTPSDARQVSDSEVADAHAAGLAVHFFYEMNPTYAAYFTYAQGAEDCRQAVERLRELGAPEGSVVYFAVDAPPSNASHRRCSTSTSTASSRWRLRRSHPACTDSRRTSSTRATASRRSGSISRRPTAHRRVRSTFGRHEQMAMCGVAVDLNECTVAGWRAKEKDMADVPELGGQGPDPILKVGEVGEVKATYRWPNGNVREVVRKVFSHKPGRTPYPLYPKVDPDADETECLDAEPAWFMVTVEKA
jgi:hypothetical protein